MFASKKRITKYIMLFALIPYLMESGFYWLPLATDHLSDTYTTLCVSIFGAWVYFACIKNLIRYYFIEYTVIYMIILYTMWTGVTLLSDTTLGFNNLQTDSLLVYIICFVLTLFVMIKIRAKTK